MSSSVSKILLELLGACNHLHSSVEVVLALLIPSRNPCIRNPLSLISFRLNLLFRWSRISLSQNTYIHASANVFKINVTFQKLQVTVTWAVLSMNIKTSIVIPGTMTNKAYVAVITNGIVYPSSLIFLHMKDSKLRFVPTVAAVWVCWRHLSIVRNMTV